MKQDVSISREFTFVCRLSGGLHARPASHLAEASNEFASDCTLTNLRNGLVANLKSVLAMIAADVRQGDECSVRVSGAHDEITCAELRHFIDHDLPAFDEPLTDVADGRSAVLPRSLRQAGVNCHFGLAVSRGIGQGKVVLSGGMALPRELSTEKAEDPRQ